MSNLAICEEERRSNPLMHRRVFIVFFFFLTLTVSAQEETRLIDSLENAIRHQEGLEKVQTMIELSYAFFDFSFDDCVDWGEKAIQCSLGLDDVELEADANYALGINYGYHSDLDLAQIYLKKAFDLYQQSGNEAKAFESIWNQAYFELVLGNMDTAYIAFEKVMEMAERREDSLACGQVSANMAFIQYQKNDFEGAISHYIACKAFYESINDSAAIAEVDLNLATIFGECGRSTEARKMFVSVIPRLEAFHNYYFMLLAYKNYGLLLERYFINYDSADYYFKKALEVTKLEDISRQDRQTIVNSKADLLVELGNVAVLKKQAQQAMAYYEEALSLAESNGYHFGQMHAMVGLGQLYAQQGQASKSLQYLDRYAKEVSRSGITMMESAVKKALILDYARLGRFDEMETALDYLDEQRAALTRETADISSQIRDLRSEAEDLILQYESQNNQIQILQSQRDQYRLAFFGLLSLALFVLVLLIAYKIVRKNRAKTEKG